MSPTTPLQVNYTINEDQTNYIIGRNHSWLYDRLDPEDIDQFNLCAEPEPTYTQTDTRRALATYNNFTAQITCIGNSLCEDTPPIYPCNINEALVRRCCF